MILFNHDSTQKRSYTQNDDKGSQQRAPYPGQTVVHERHQKTERQSYHRHANDGIHHRNPDQRKYQFLPQTLVVHGLRT